MDYIKMLQGDSGLSDLLCDVCDVEILSEFEIPQDEGGHLTYNLSGKTFAKAGIDTFGQEDTIVKRLPVTDNGLSDRL